MAKTKQAHRRGKSTETLQIRNANGSTSFVARKRNGAMIALSPRNARPQDVQVRVLIGTPTLGLVRVEWHNAMVGLVMPPNWSAVRSLPQGFAVADAQNILVDTVLRDNFRALILIEDDTVPPLDAILSFDRWFWKMERKLAPPVVSGLYHIKGSAEVRAGDTGGIALLGPEPLAYRGSGQRAYRDWKAGDVIWVSGIPTGALLLHRSILEAWAREPDVPTYSLPGYPWQLKRIFQNPSKIWVDPDTKATTASSGTSDLWWSEETIKRKILAKAGWPKRFADRPHPFIVDTALKFGHIDRVDGKMW